MYSILIGLLLMYLSSRKILSNKNHPSTILEIILLSYIEGLSSCCWPRRYLCMLSYSTLFSLFLLVHWLFSCRMLLRIVYPCLSVRWFFRQVSWNALLFKPKPRPLPQSDFLTGEKSAPSMPVARVPRCVHVIIRWCDVLTMCLRTRSQVEHPNTY